MGRPRWEVAGNEMRRRVYHSRRDVQDEKWQIMRWEDGWDFQDRKWQVMRWEDESTTWHETSKMGSGRQRDGNTNLPHDMGLPSRRWDFQDGKWQIMRWEDEFSTGDMTSKMGSGRYNKMGRRIYHRRCDVQDGKWQVMRWEDEFTTWHGTSKRDGTSKIGSGRNWNGKTNLPQEMGLPSRRWDFQDGKWQVMRWMRWEDEFTKGDGTSKIGRGRSWDGKTSLPQEMGRPRWEVAGNEMGRRTYHRRWDVQDAKWQVMEDAFTTGDGTSKMGSGRQWDEKTSLPQ